jgi:4-amino-4-deoxy-L-arabinose transferase-like glycosyltransferase
MSISLKRRYNFGVHAAPLLLLTLLAFALRLSYLTRFVFDVDEFITMLAATIIARRGLPILPSGLFYDNGLLFSYLDALFVGVSGFSEAMARWPSVLLGTLAIPLAYRTARELFDSPWAGLVAALILALDPESILAGGRARMYAMANLFVLLAVLFLWRGTLSGDRPRQWLLSLASYLCALLSHPATIVLFPALAGAPLLIGLGIGGRQRLWRPRLALELLTLLLVVLLFFSLSKALHIEAATAGERGEAGQLAQGNAPWWASIFQPSLVWEEGLEKFYEFFTSSSYLPATILALIALAPLLAWRWRRPDGSDLAALYLAILTFGTTLAMGVLLSGAFRKTRYLIPLTPLLFLMAGQGAARLGALTAWAARKAYPRHITASLGPVAISVLGLILALLAWPGALHAATTSSTGGYDTAFRYVREHWSPGDRVMTVHPSASYLYLGRCDFYADQKTVRLLEGSNAQAVDRYTGAPWIGNVEALNKTLAPSEGGRIWLVADTEPMGKDYEPFFTQQIFAQMDLLRDFGGVLVMAKKENPQPIPRLPAHLLDADLAAGPGQEPLFKLVGYALDHEENRSGEVIRLTLFWQPLARTEESYKVFVHLRDPDGRTVAQADHDPFASVFPTSTWFRLWRLKDVVRETSELTLPAGLPAGTYRLLVGMYDWQNMERLIVISDTSGENAVVLGNVEIR